jgi:hypothetical protein
MESGTTTVEGEEIELQMYSSTKPSEKLRCDLYIKYKSVTNEIQPRSKKDLSGI